VELLPKLGFIGLVIKGTIVVGFLAMIAYSALRHLRPNDKNSLPISCVIAALMLIGFFRFLVGNLLFTTIINITASGFLAFLILRLLFKDEIEAAQAKDQEMIEGGNGPDQK
jgi:hypothetical protein